MMHPIKHFITITKHRHVVFRHCVKAGIPWQGITHDLSKYSPTEFLEGAKYYLGDRSPQVAAREDIGYSNAWMHHKGRNKHHFEYWTDYIPETHGMGPVKMPLKYVAEMFCDRVAASKVYLGNKYTDSYPLEYFNHGKSMRMIHKDTSDLLEKWLTELGEKGEDEVFKEIRQMIKDKKDY